MPSDAVSTPLTRENLIREMQHALDGIGVGWEGWPAEALNTQLTGRHRLAALLLVMDESPALVNGWPFRSVEDTIVRTFPRKKLPWDEASAVFALEAALTIDCMNYVCGPALRGAQVAMDAGARGPALFDVLTRCAAHLTGLGQSRWGVDADRRLAERLLAAFMPRGLLDLSAVRDGDGWAEPAREAARATPHEAAETLVLTLSDLGHKSLSQTWQKRVQAALAPDGARGMVATWLRIAADVDEVRDPADGQVRLFVAGNDDVVRAAALTARWLTEEEMPAALLGVLVRRGAATRPPGTESLALRVASAGIDSLVARDGDADRAELKLLLEDITRRDLVKKIGAALGAEGVAVARDRDALIAKEKARVVRAKSDPLPRLLRADVDRELREHLDDTMRALGFRKDGRTWRRDRGNRIDVVNFSSSGPWVAVQYGVYWTALHPEDGPRHAYDVSRLKAHDLDILIVEQGWEAEEDDLVELAVRMRRMISPFLDACGSRRFLVGLWTAGTGIPLSARGSGDLWLNRKPFPHEVALGALALAEDDPAAARWWFAEAARAIAERSSTVGVDELAYWNARWEEYPLPPA
ncbi:MULTISPECIES: DUF4304 domain-containing protein [unclassified Microbacterium]|uniref:DUF4304 domain-containing protein n=1 Tax=unclassified Microbacterium TaxID=2609290 RepID=UPI0034182292